VTKIVLALNVETSADALGFLDRTGQGADVYKLGIDLFARTGPELVRQFTGRGAPVFLDLKYSDIPSVVGKAVSAAAELGVAMLTVHTMGGPKMLEAAAQAAARSSTRPLVLGVTVLTSLDEAALERVSGRRQPVAERVEALALMARDCGCGGVVSSPNEIAVIRAACGSGLKIVTPGIRMSSDAADDQARTMTPAEAARAGADYIVVGRPVYAAADPLAALAKIRQELGGNS
jgi:orotidine-5'-phosphate decarboxylase